jgi:hypothetical protein
MDSIDQWRAVVDTMMNFRVPENVGKFLSKLSDWRQIIIDSVQWS